jgi:hypothetical protein
MGEDHPRWEGPLPRWTPITLSGPYEAPDPDGRVWRVWRVDVPGPGDPFPVGWRLAPRDDLGNINFIPGDGGLYSVLDLAGLRIAADAVRADPDGARRQLGLEELSDPGTTPPLYESGCGTLSDHPGSRP